MTLSERWHKVEDVEWTEDQIYQAALEEWLGVLSRLWVAFGKPIDPVQMTIYRDMLGRLPLGLLEQAIELTVREHVYNTVPTVAEVWQAARKVLGNPNPHYLDQAIERWEEQRWRRICVQFPAAAEVVAVETERVA